MSAPIVLRINSEEKGSSAPGADLWGCRIQRSAKGKGEWEDVASEEGRKSSSLMALKWKRIQNGRQQ